MDHHDSLGPTLPDFPIPQDRQEDGLASDYVPCRRRQKGLLCARGHLADSHGKPIRSSPNRRYRYPEPLQVASEPCDILKPHNRKSNDVDSRGSGSTAAVDVLCKARVWTARIPFDFAFPHETPSNPPVTDGKIDDSFPGMMVASRMLTASPSRVDVSLLQRHGEGIKNAHMCDSRGQSP